MLEKNPAIGVKQFNIDNRIQRFLDESELKRFLSVLATDKNRTVCLIVLFLLSTGARLGEALKVKWEDIDIATRVWRIPDTPVIHVDAGYLMTAVGHSGPTQKTSEGLLCPAIPDIPAL